MSRTMRGVISIGTAYRALHRLGYVCLVPRPRHENHDPQAQRKFKEEEAPLF